MTRLPNLEIAKASIYLTWEVITFDISARFIIRSAAARLSSSVQLEAIIRTLYRVSRNQLETVTAVRVQDGEDDSRIND